MLFYLSIYFYIGLFIQRTNANRNENRMHNVQSHSERVHKLTLFHSSMSTYRRCWIDGTLSLAVTNRCSMPMVGTFENGARCIHSYQLLLRIHRIPRYASFRMTRVPNCREQATGAAIFSCKRYFGSCFFLLLLSVMQ